MGKLSTRLGIYLMGGGATGLNTPPESMDIDKINAGFEKVDAAIGAFPCTSTTRPADPYPGMPIYERDTEGIAVWDDLANSGSGDWVYVAGGKQPKMRLTKTSPATVTTTATDVQWNVHQYFRGFTHNVVAPNSAEVTVTKTGLYKFLIRLAAGASGTSPLTGTVLKNGVILDRFSTDAQGSTSAFPKVYLQGTVDLAVGDKVKVQVKTGTGSVDLESSQCFWEMEYDGPVFS